tara:strand:+ start:1706 stop:2881 length:1176 start_codon:yes stop_codon:yes gene_type:complete
MKHQLSDVDIELLDHIVFVAEKSAKTIQICLRKGLEQSYVTPKEELFLTFNLSSPLKFDYPIADLKTFLASASFQLDSDKNNTDISQLVLPTQRIVNRFVNKDIVQEIDFTYEDIKTNQRMKKLKYLNILGMNNQLAFRYQNHERSWWADSDDKQVFLQGKSSRKFRYVIARDKLRLYPVDYKLILRKDVIQFQYKHLNYYFLPEVSWLRQSVRDWTDAVPVVDDIHLREQYIKKGLMRQTDGLSISHATEKDFDEIMQIVKPYKKQYFPHLRTDYIMRMIKSGNIVLSDEVFITYNHYQKKYELCEGIIARKGEVILHQIASKKHNGSASKVLQQFFQMVNCRVFLSVRSDNHAAKKFYERNNMKLVGHTSWKEGSILGDVYMSNTTSFK